MRIIDKNIELAAGHECNIIYKYFMLTTIKVSQQWWIDQK